jgi:hypothetical protein
MEAVTSLPGRIASRPGALGAAVKRAARSVVARVAAQLAAVSKTALLAEQRNVKLRRL